MIPRFNTEPFLSLSDTSIPPAFTFFSRKRQLLVLDGSSSCGQAAAAAWKQQLGDCLHWHWQRNSLAVFLSLSLALPVSPLMPNPPFHSPCVSVRLSWSAQASLVEQASTAAACGCTAQVGKARHCQLHTSEPALRFNKGLSRVERLVYSLFLK